MAVILVVDDEKANRALLRAYLASSPHTIIEAQDGLEALERVTSNPPDLVLLDVVMPRMDGFEVTRRLRERGDGSFLPVILVTALTDQESRRRGLDAGADEFLTKPVDPQELALRLRNLLALRDKSTSLAERNTELAELQRFKDEMTALLVHDLKNPLSVIMTNLEFVAAGCGEDIELVGAVEDSRAAARRLQELLANLVDTQRLESARLEPARRRLKAADWLAPLMAARRWEAATRSVALELSIDEDATLELDPTLMTRVVENLLDNAMRYAPGGGKVRVEVALRGQIVELTVGNSGPAIPEPMRDRIFDKYGQASGIGRMNLGLGLYFCRLAVEAQGGRISVRSLEKLPTCFVIELPSAVELVTA